MNKKLRTDKKTQLTEAIADGQAVAKWAKENDVARRTAFRWASDPELKRTVESSRREALDQAIGRMASRASWAADGIVELAEHAESEAVKLRARRAILIDQMAMTKFTGLEQRLCEVEEQLREQSEQPPCAG